MFAALALAGWAFVTPVGHAAYPATTVAAAPEPATPVVVELFTSEGCSSCPPADRLLAQLDQTQPVPGAQIIALEQHVDYWNDLGWMDPFSSVLFSERQQDYINALHASTAYTPEMVVDGAAEFVGGDGASDSRGHREILATSESGRGDRTSRQDPTLASPQTAPLHVRLVPSPTGTRMKPRMSSSPSPKIICRPMSRGEKTPGRS